MVKNLHVLGGGGNIAESFLPKNFGDIGPEILPPCISLFKFIKMYVSTPTNYNQND
jgi:hypothetical protein